jgi:hypothetical protein
MPTPFPSQPVTVTGTSSQLTCAWCHQSFTAPHAAGLLQLLPTLASPTRLRSPPPSRYRQGPRVHLVTVTSPVPLTLHDRTGQRRLRWLATRASRTRDPLVELLTTLSDELADLWTAACKVDMLRAELDQADPDQPVDLDRLSDAADAAVGGDTPVLLASLQRLGLQHAYRRANTAALDRRNAIGILR